MTFLESMKVSTRISVAGEWDVHQNLIHCAQSLEFALTGYPAEKSKSFQHTLGKLVFHYFDWKGYMRHATNKQNEGEPLVVRDDYRKGITRLENAILQFDKWEGPFKPHRFYGELSKKQYARANTMHIANHLELITLE